MAASNVPAIAKVSETTAAALPWWTRLRWRQTSHIEAVAAEKNLLALANAPVTPRDVPVGESSQQFMHTLASSSPSNAPALVCIAGYGAGAGFFFRNFEFLASKFRLMAVDLLGTGLSGRPRFTAGTREEAESFFVNALDQWRASVGLDKMILLGHSMGGYLAASYAMQYPQHVDHLLLVCPAGVGEKPSHMREPEFLQNRWSLKANAYKLARAAWTAGVTPGTLIRGVGPLGPRLVHGYASRRFDLTNSEVEAFREYMYHVLAAPGSGEFALRHILMPFAWPHAPLEHRIHNVKVPVTFIYGEHDWMDPRAGKRACDRLQESRSPLNATDAKLFLVPSSGHYPFIEQPEMFHEALEEACKPYLTAVPPHPDMRPVQPDSDMKLQLDEPPETPAGILADL